jgi:hypothetical protein
LDAAEFMEGTWTSYLVDGWLRPDLEKMA